RLPHLVPPRPGTLADRHVGGGDPRARAGGPCMGRGASRSCSVSPADFGTPVLRAAVAFGRTAPLRRELQAALSQRPFALALWDGSAVPATMPGSPTFSFRSPRAIAHMLRAPGELGLGRAYVAGLLEVDDIDAALHLVDAW